MPTGDQYPNYLNTFSANREKTLQPCPTCGQRAAKEASFTHIPGNPLGDFTPSKAKI